MAGYNFNLGPLNIHQGSWWGLPDIGATELVGDLINAGRTQEGGSAIRIARARAQTMPQTIEAARRAGEQASLAAATRHRILGNTPVSPTTTPPPTSTSTNDGGGGGGNGQMSLDELWRSLGYTGDRPVGWHGPASVESPEDRRRKEEEKRRELEQEAESLYAPVQKFYKELISEYESQIPEAKQEIESSLGRGIRQYEDIQKQKLAETEEGKRQVGEAEQNALALARRAYNELKQGFISRFGAGSSAGPAANEILSAATVRQIGEIGKEAQKGLRQLDMEFNRVKDFVARKKADLTSIAEDNKKEAARNIRARIANVKRDQGLAETAKRKLIVDELRAYKDRIFQIDQTERAYQQQIDMFERQKKAELELVAQQYKTMGTGTGSSVLNSQRAINTILTATKLYGPKVGKQIAQDVFGITGAIPLNQNLIWDAARGVWLDPTNPQKVIKPEGLPNPLTGFTTDPKTGLPILSVTPTQTQTGSGLLSRIGNFIGGFARNTPAYNVSSTR